MMTENCALSVQAENIEADFCNTGKEGLQKLREQEYQLVVLDLMMVRHGLDMSKLQKVRKQSILMTMPFRRISVTMQII